MPEYKLSLIMKIEKFSHQIFGQVFTIKLKKLISQKYISKIGSIYSLFKNASTTLYNMIK